jgi:hypothetical protein
MFPVDFETISSIRKSGQGTNISANGMMLTDPIDMAKGDQSFACQ